MSASSRCSASVAAATRGTAATASGCAMAPPGPAMSRPWLPAWNSPVRPLRSRTSARSRPLTTATTAVSARRSTTRRIPGAMAAAAGSSTMGLRVPSKSRKTASWRWPRSAAMASRRSPTAGKRRGKRSAATSSTTRWAPAAARASAAQPQSVPRTPTTRPQPAARPACTPSAVSASITIRAGSTRRRPAAPATALAEAAPGGSGSGSRPPRRQRAVATSRRTASPSCRWVRMARKGVMDFILPEFLREDPAVTTCRSVIPTLSRGQDRHGKHSPGRPAGGHHGGLPGGAAGWLAARRSRRSPRNAGAMARREEGAPGATRECRLAGRNRGYCRTRPAISPATRGRHCLNKMNTINCARHERCRELAQECRRGTGGATPDHGASP